MKREIKMPDLGTTVAELNIMRWLVKEGDFIKRGQPLLEVETDKTTTEVESYCSGYLVKIVVPENESVLSGDTIALIGDREDLTKGQ